MFVIYSRKSKEKTNISEEFRYLYNSIDTFIFRYELSEYSNNIFLLYRMGDPIELIIYLLENCLKINSDFIHKLFYIDIREKYFCLKDKNEKEIKYDKDNFLREIYIEEIINFSIMSKLSFNEFNSNLFAIFKEVSYQHVKKCDKCHCVMEKRTICNYLPKYFFINCVWSNKNPNKEDIIKFYSMIQFNFNSIEMFDIKTEKIYSFFGMILYCYYMCHYINVIYDEKKDIFILFNDELIIKFKSFKELINYLTGKDENDKYIFYPVLITYNEIPEESIKIKEINLECYMKLMKKTIQKNKEENKTNLNTNIINNDDESINQNILDLEINKKKEEKKEEDRISIYDQMTNKVDNISYYNELNKYHLESLIKKSEQKKPNHNEDLKIYKDNVRNETAKRSVSLEKNKFNSIQKENSLLHNNQKKKNDKEQNSNDIHINRKYVKPNIQEKNSSNYYDKYFNSMYNFNQKNQNNPELKSKNKTFNLNSFNKVTKS